MNTTSTNPKSDGQLRLANYLSWTDRIEPALKDNVLNVIQGKNPILICHEERSSFGTSLSVLGAMIIASCVAMVIAMFISLFLGKVSGIDSVAIFYITATAGVLIGCVYGYSTYLEEETFTNCMIERRLDLTTREYIVEASGYEIKTRTVYSLREAFPFDDLVLAYNVDFSDEDSCLLYLAITISEEKKSLYSSFSFKINTQIYSVNAYFYRNDTIPMPDDFKRIADVLVESTKLKLVNMIPRNESKNNRPLSAKKTHRNPVRKSRNAPSVNTRPT